MRVCFVVEESLKGKVVSSFAGSLTRDDPAPSDGDVQYVKARTQAQWMSIADISDSTLQFVRERFRRGASAKEVQSAVYEAYGPQWASSAQPDSYSNIGKFI